MARLNVFKFSRTTRDPNALVTRESGPAFSVAPSIQNNGALTRLEFRPNIDHQLVLLGEAVAWKRGSAGSDTEYRNSWLVNHPCSSGWFSWTAMPPLPPIEYLSEALTMAHTVLDRRNLNRWLCSPGSLERCRARSAACNLR
jgi:hypothetical protein